MEIASVLRDARCSAGVSQRRLARSARTSQAAIARYEAGRVVPSIETLERLFGALGLRLELRTVPRLSGPRGRLLERHRDDVVEICRRHGATSPRVFGSVARGEDRPDSDIDLLVDLEEGRTLLDLERLQVELSELLSTPVDVGTEALLRGGVSEAVRHDLIPLQVTPREAEERLRDILHAVARIESHTRALENASYERDPAEADVYKDAVHYQLIVIGEAIAALPDEVKAMDPEIPWKAIVGLRNRLAHEYFLIDPAVIREVVKKDLADLSSRVRRLTGG